MGVSRTVPTCFPESIFRTPFDGRVIVFATQWNLETLAKSEMWFVDRTFKVFLISVNYFQLYNFMYII